jgi:predicted small metal-binding protein
MTGWKLNCACGWTVTVGEGEVVEAALRHGRELHNMEVTREQALAMAEPVED